jgi:hypothetical protein
MEGEARQNDTNWPPSAFHFNTFISIYPGFSWHARGVKQALGALLPAVLSTLHS